MAKRACILMMLLAGLVANALDWQVVHQKILQTGSIVPGDQFIFRANAQWALHHAASASAATATNLLYPAPFLLLAAPFSWLSPLAGYLLWIMTGNLLLAFAARAVGLPWPAVLLGLVSPANLYCVAMGQSGLFVSAFSLLSLGLMARQPVLAGVAAGCLVIKPQFALLLPICFVAARNWRGLGAGAVTVALLWALSAVIFGVDTCRALFLRALVLQGHLMHTAWPDKFQYTMVTVFMMCRSLGAGLPLSETAQGVSSLAAVVFAWRLWRGDGGLGRIGITLCLAALATPYAYTYDLAALGIALAGCAWLRGGSLAPVALFWVFTGFYVFFSTFWFLTGALFLGAIALLIQASGRFSVEKLRKRLLLPDVF